MEFHGGFERRFKEFHYVSGVFQGHFNGISVNFSRFRKPVRTVSGVFQQFQSGLMSVSRDLWGVSDNFRVSQGANPWGFQNLSLINLLHLKHWLNLRTKYPLFIPCSNLCTPSSWHEKKIQCNKFRSFLNSYSLKLRKRICWPINMPFY